MPDDRTPDARAVDYILGRIVDDGWVAYLLGAGTQVWRLLTEAHCARSGEDPDEYRRSLWAACRPIRVRPSEAE
ncbi:MAG: hypothetical protein KGN77_02000 [Xanthomonadaceae bacterium]|nr:hypothetical protein [Xanthomonadaceae bacterium]